jgi:hypothetical protein
MRRFLIQKSPAYEIFVGAGEINDSIIHLLRPNYLYPPLLHQ